MEEEVWKSIKGYEGLYEVSNLGRYKSLDREIKCGYNSTRISKGKILRLHKDKFGNLKMWLQVTNKIKILGISRCVYQTFIASDIENKTIVHKDGDNSNNAVNNLQLCNSPLNKKVYEKVYRKCNPEKVNKWHRKYVKSRGEDYKKARNDYVSNRQKQKVSELDAKYITKLLAISYPEITVPQEFIKIKQLLIKTKRLCKTFKNLEML